MAALRAAARTLAAAATHGGATFEFVMPRSGVVGPAKSAYGPQAELVTAGMLLRMKRRVDKAGTVAIDSKATVFSALETMRDQNVGALVVTGANPAAPSAGPVVVGLLTERDYLSKVALCGRRSKDTEVREIMTTSLIVANTTDPLNSVVHKLASCDFRHLPVLNYTSKGDARSLLATHDLAGMLSIKDVLWMLYGTMFPSAGDAEPVVDWTKLTVKDIVARVGQEPGVVHSMAPSDTVKDAINEMARLNVGALVLKDVDHTILGIVSERDYRDAVVLEGRSSETTLVSEICSLNPVCVTPSHTLESVLKVFVAAQFRHLPVVKSIGDSGPSGVIRVISMRDVLQTIVAQVDSAT